MASAVVDQSIYKGGQESERYDCESSVLERIAMMWWNEASLVDNYLEYDFEDAVNPSFRRQLPKHEWRWPKIGLDHTDPSKVATALQILHDKGFILDEDIQKTYYNRDLGTWQRRLKAENEFRQTIKPPNPEDNPDNMPKPGPASGGASRNGNGKPASNGAAK
jgi:hypothetical protein